MNKTELTVPVFSIDRRLSVKNDSFEPKNYTFPPESIISIRVEVHNFGNEVEYHERPVTVITANDGSDYFTFEPYKALMDRLS